VPPCPPVWMVSPKRSMTSAFPESFLSCRATTCLAQPCARIESVAGSHQRNARADCGERDESIRESFLHCLIPLCRCSFGRPAFASKKLLVENTRGEAVVRTENRCSSCNSSRARFSSRAACGSANMLPIPISNPSDGTAGIIVSTLLL
jgi:hypothetical protein